MQDSDPVSSAPGFTLSKSPRRRYWRVVGVSGLPIVVLLTWVGRRIWFFGDEWAVVHSSLSRDGIIRSLLTPHNEHLVATPIAVFRLLLRTFGLRSYVPYLFTAITAHVVVASLCGYIALRLSAMSWVGIGTFLLVSFFGAGAENLYWAFQLTFVLAAGGTVACVALLFDDHAQRRPYLLALAGTIAVTSSGPGLAVIAPITIAVVRAVRSGRAVVRTVAFSLVPFVLYGSWFLHYRPASNKLLFQNGRYGLAILEAATNSWTVPTLGMITLIAGVTFCWRSSSVDVAVVGALIGGCAVFLALTALARDPSLAAPDSSRYLYQVTVLLVPVVVAGLALYRTAFAAVFLGVALATNASVLGKFAAGRAALAQGSGDLLVAEQVLANRNVTLPGVSVDKYTVDISPADLREMARRPRLRFRRRVDQAMVDRAAAMVSLAANVAPPKDAKPYREALVVKSSFMTQMVSDANCDTWTTGPEPGAVEADFRAPGAVGVRWVGTGAGLRVSTVSSIDAAHRAEVHPLTAGESSLAWALRSGSATFELAPNSKLRLCRFSG